MESPIDAIMDARRGERSTGFFRYCDAHLGAAAESGEHVRFWFAANRDIEIVLDADEKGIREIEQTLADWVRRHR